MTVSPSRRWPWVAALAGLLALVGAGVYAARFLGKAAPPPPVRPPEPPADIAFQVHNFCGGTCHVYPPADTFPRRHWRAEVERGFRFFEQAGLPLKAPPIDSVVRYYEERAPEDLPPIAFQPASRPLDLTFEKRSYPGPAGLTGFAISNVNLVRLPDPRKGAPPKGQAPTPLDVLACDMRGGLVLRLRPYEPKPSWEVLANHAENKLAPVNPAHAEVVDLNGDGLLDILVADLGSFPPTDSRCGRVVWLRGEKDGTFTPFTLLEGVGRVADVQAADFRGTGKKDLVVAVFGWQTAGNLLLLENQTEDWDRPTFVQRVLDERHGAIHVPVADLDGDGKPDFVCLFAQEHETVVAFLNEGGGSFRKKTLYEAPHPGYGSSGIQLADLDGDGLLDVLYSNGDTLDAPYLFKPYHGVQWLRNKGKLEFEHRHLTAMYGVHRAVAGDLRGKGKQDIVAVSFLPEDKFPDRVQRKADAIVILEQVAPGKFERHSLAAAHCDHVTVAVGDVYGTGRQDIVVGNFGALTTDHPVMIWKNVGPRKDEVGRMKDE